MISINVDMEGQRLKSSTLRAVPRAFQRNATQWASQTVRYIKNELKGGTYFKRPPKEIDQRLGMKVVKTGPDSVQILLGTGGVIGKKEVVYAKIQDEGGTIKAIDKFFSIANLPGRPRVGPFLTIPLGNTKGRVANYKNTFNIRAKSGNFLVMRSSRATGSVTTKRVYDPLTGRRSRGAPQATMTPLFLLKRQVTLSASRWFTGPINQRRPLLDQMTSPDGVWATAMKLTQKETGAQGGKA